MVQNLWNSILTEWILLNKKYLWEEIQYLLDNDFNEPNQSEWSSPDILLPKPDGTYRMCTDFRKVNSLSKPDSSPILRIDDCSDKIGNVKYKTHSNFLKDSDKFLPMRERERERERERASKADLRYLIQQTDYFNIKLCHMEWKVLQ